MKPTVKMLRTSMGEVCRFLAESIQCLLKCHKKLRTLITEVRRFRAETTYFI